MMTTELPGNLRFTVGGVAQHCCKIEINGVMVDAARVIALAAAPAPAPTSDEAYWRGVADTQRGMHGPLNAAPAPEPLTDEPEFTAWWDSLAPAPYYPGIRRRIALHAWKKGRAALTADAGNQGGAAT